MDEYGCKYSVTTGNFQLIVFAVFLIMIQILFSDEAVAIRQLIEEHQSELKNLYKQQELLRADLELSTNNEKEREQVCSCIFAS